MHEVYLVRHAVAAERGEDWPDDRLRPLTGEGIRRFKGVVRGLVRLEVELDLVLTSPLTRARETAELLVSGLHEPPGLKVLSELAPGTSPGRVIAAVFRRTRMRRLALVGHEPDLGHLAAFLVGATRPLAFKKGGICRIDVSGRGLSPHGTLAWMAPPRLLRLIAGR